MATHQRVAEAYLRDGSLDTAVPPIRGLLEIMARGTCKRRTASARRGVPAADSPANPCWPVTVPGAAGRQAGARRPAPAARHPEPAGLHGCPDQRQRRCPDRNGQPSGKGERAAGRRPSQGSIASRWWERSGGRWGCVVCEPPGCEPPGLLSPRRSPSLAPPGGATGAALSDDAPSRRSSGRTGVLLSGRTV